MKASEMSWRWGLGAALVSLLAACAGGQTPLPAAPVATSIPSVAPSSSPTPRPTQTPTPTDVPTATPTSTPTPHPLMIQALRGRDYPGSQVAIEQTLERGSNYSRYIASYRSDGLKIYALLTIPDGQQPTAGWPVIIFNHGYIPPAQYRTTERYVSYVDWLARSGYIVFRPDYRGHGDSEGDATGAYGSPGYTLDVLNAVASMKRFPEADPDRMGMWGHSLGGYLTLRSMVVSPDIKAGVIWAGVVASYPDLLSRWRRASAGVTATPGPGRRWRQELVAQFGTPDENPEFWNAISANSYLGELSGPVQLHHGAADASVPLEFSESLSRQIATADQIVEFYAYEGDDHNLSDYFSLAMRRTIEFFDKYVKGS